MKLGIEVQDIVSGLKGILVSKTTYLNGCVQYGVQPRLLQTSTDIVTYNIDEEQLVPTKRKVPKIKKTKSTGGPTTKVADARTRKLPPESWTVEKR